MVISKSDSSIFSIAIVDDDEMCLELLTQILSDQGYQVISAASGREILELATKNQPDLFLLDIFMPGMDGFEVCQNIKSNEMFENVPVIFISSLSESFNKLKGFELGAVDYIDKPFSVDEVLSRVGTHLELSIKIKELEQMNAAMIKREMRVIELKTEVNKLAEELHRKPPYEVVWGDVYKHDNN